MTPRPWFSRKLPVLIHSNEVGRMLRDEYSRGQLRALRKSLSPLLKLELTDANLVRAADRAAASWRHVDKGPAKDPTGYDSVWLRDSLWVYLALRNRTGPERSKARRLLRALLELLCTPTQLKRLHSVIRAPAEAGPMDVLHIRFVRARRGEPEPFWNHRQHDALGLFYDLLLRALDSRELDPKQLQARHWELLTFLPLYFARIRFHEAPDAGCWEESERLNTSSVALVTSSLETLLAIVRKKTAFSTELGARLAKKALCPPERIEELHELGYERIFRQLALGGESPCYAPDDPRYREADAALLHLLFPARLSRLSTEHERRILTKVSTLIGRAGIRRYRGDSYQSANYWQRERHAHPDTGSAESATRALESRDAAFIPDTEAQWFFDSWVSLAIGQRIEARRTRALLEEQTWFFNRALGQITGGSAERPVLAADGSPVPPMTLPESYNVMIEGGRQYFAPSPIVPLNWAKASFSLALDEMERTHRLPLPRR